LRTISIQSDHKILIGGGASYPYPYYQTNFYVLRLNEVGTVDPTFGSNGLFLTNFENSETNYVTAMQFQNNSILAFGCSKTDDNEFRTAILCRITNESLSILNYDEERSIIYPNPTFNSVFIKSNEVFNKILIYDLQGKLIRYNIFDSITELDYELVDLNKGVYYLFVFNNNKLITKKTIIKK